MADVNNVTIGGRLVRDAELKYSNSGMAITRMSIATNARKKDGDNWIDEANFFDVTMFGRLGESLNNYLTKGKQVVIEGSLHQDRWEQEGQTRTRINIIANNIMLTGSRNDTNDGFEQAPPAKTNSDNVSKRVVSRPTISESDFDDDIPF